MKDVCTSCSFKYIYELYWLRSGEFYNEIHLLITGNKILEWWQLNWIASKNKKGDCSGYCWQCKCAAWLFTWLLQAPSSNCAINWLITSAKAQFNEWLELTKATADQLTERYIVAAEMLASIIRDSMTWNQGLLNETKLAPFCPNLFWKGGEMSF